MKHLIPTPKTITYGEGHFAFDGSFSLASSCDKRVTDTALRMGHLGEGGAVISHGTEGEGYTLDITDNKGIEIVGEGPAGAFYGLQTLSQIRREYGDNLPFVHVEDSPSFPQRGFYHDVTRGKVPTLEMLFRMADILASLKINQLQLYVEDAYAFSVYDGIIPEDCKISHEEILALDAYCHDRFIELVPSVSTFGHLYNLLQSPKYRHLCEYENYTPTEDYWIEKMRHHTIDVSSPESIEVIGSMIDEYAPLFRSGKFNICCDETFDLCKGKNAGKDAGEEYVKFLLQIIERVKRHGKTVQMWGDILLKHPEVISLLPRDTVMLNWNYSKAPGISGCDVFAASGLSQLVCPGTTTWSRFAERVEVGLSNIAAMARAGQTYGAVGLLNTNWGDFGNPCSLYTALFGIAAGAAYAWNPTGTTECAVGEAVSRQLYGCEKDMLSVLRRVGAAEDACTMGELVRWYSKNFMEGIATPLAANESRMKAAIADCSAILRELASMPDTPMFADLRLAVRAISVLNSFGLRIKGAASDHEEDLESFLLDLRKAWLRDNKPSELWRLEGFFRRISTCKTENELKKA